MVASKPRILLVEDNEDDVNIFQWAVRRSQLDWDLQIVDGTDAAIRFLAPNNLPPPQLILTALLLRERSGYDLIAWARSQAHLQQVPIIALSAAMKPSDRQRALALGASHFVEKTSPIRDALVAIQTLFHSYYPESGTADPLTK